MACSPVFSGGFGGFDFKGSARSNVERYNAYRRTSGGGNGGSGGGNTGLVVAIAIVFFVLYALYQIFS